MDRKRIALAGMWLAVLVVGVATFYRLRYQPFYYDAKGYVEAAEGMRAQGFLSGWPYAELRTYGYPLLLSAALRIAEVLHLSLLTMVFGIQWLIFVGTAWFAASTLFRSPRTRVFAFLAVAANPLLVAYTAQPLTESVTLVCILFSTAALGRGSRARSRPAAAAWLAGGAVTAGYALALRPGNLLIPICYGAAALAALIWTKNRRSWLAVTGSALLVLAALAAPLVPQAVVNWHNYQVATVMPVIDIAALQSDLGIKNIRYATNVAACGGPGLAFPSPFAGQVQPDLTLAGLVRYYALTWPDGPETAAMHVFSGLDPRPFLTYQVSFGAGYERVLQVLTVGLLGLACFGVVRAPWSRRRLTPDVLFLGAATLCSVAILAVSQAELRFGVVLVAAVSLLAASGASRLRRPSVRAGVVTCAAFITAVLVWFALSDLVLATSDVWQECT